MDIKVMIAECIGLFRKIEEEYPGELRLDELHEVAGTYAKLKEYKERIHQYPRDIISFCEYILATSCPHKELKIMLSHLINYPGAFRRVKGETFIEKRRRFDSVAKDIGIHSSTLFRLMGIAKLKGLLDDRDELFPQYRLLIENYLKE